MNGNGMSEKEKADLYAKLAAAAWEQFKNRRSYEWKMAFGAWTAYGDGAMLHRLYGSPLDRCCPSGVAPGTVDV